MIHPVSKYERLRIKNKKDEQKKRTADKAVAKAGRLWRANKERDKLKETENELEGYLPGL